MRALILVTVAAAGIMLAADSHAQTAAQWSQLVGYVGQQSRLIIDMRTRLERLEAENGAQRDTINRTIAALDNERCRVGRLTGALKEFAVSPPAAPAYPAWITLDVACADLKSARPAIPPPLPPPAAP